MHKYVQLLSGDSTPYTERINPMSKKSNRKIGYALELLYDIMVV